MLLTRIAMCRCSDWCLSGVLRKERAPLPRLWWVVWWEAENSTLWPAVEV